MDLGEAKPSDRCMDPNHWRKAGRHVSKANKLWLNITRAMAGEDDEDEKDDKSAAQQATSLDEALKAKLLADLEERQQFVETEQKINQLDPVTQMMARAGLVKME